MKVRISLLFLLLVGLLGIGIVVYRSKLKSDIQISNPQTATNERVPLPSTVQLSDLLHNQTDYAALPPSQMNVGSSTCQECHPKKHKAWSKSWHAKALQPANKSSVVGNFKHVHFAGSSSEAWMIQRADQPAMKTGDHLGSLRERTVEWTIGGKRMQDYVTVLPDGRWQVLPVYYHVTGKGEWVDYNEAKQGAVTPDHPFFWTNWRRNVQHECLDCHVTGMEVTYNRQTDRWTTTFTEAGVACESCHGAGERHSESKEPRDIIVPSKLSKQLELAICAQCHGPREPVFPILSSSSRFRPGSAYSDYYLPLSMVDGNSRSTDFFPDGRPDSSSFEYQALIQSRCYLEGSATCLSCHTAPHEPHGPSEIQLDQQIPRERRLNQLGDATCRSCHPAFVAGVVAHTRHRSPDAQRCVACHMPKVVSGVLDKFADHSLDIPVPQNTKRHGIPNACNECHHDRTADEMVEAMERLWPGVSKKQQRRIQLADAFDDATQERSRIPLEAVMTDHRESPYLRALAIQLFAERFPRSAASIVVPFLTDPDPLVRARAAEAMDRAGPREAAEELFTLISDPVLSVRIAAVKGLIARGDERALPPLLELCQNPHSKEAARPHIMLGMVAMQEGNLSLASSELETSLDLLPYNTAAALILSDVYRQVGNGERARAPLELVLRFDPHNAKAISKLASLDYR